MRWSLSRARSCHVVMRVSALAAASQYLRERTSRTAATDMIETRSTNERARARSSALVRGSSALSRPLRLPGLSRPVLPGPPCARLSYLQGRTRQDSGAAREPQARGAHGRRPAAVRRDPPAACRAQRRAQPTHPRDPPCRADPDPSTVFQRIATPLILKTTGRVSCHRLGLWMQRGRC